MKNQIVKIGIWLGIFLAGIGVTACATTKPADPSRPQNLSTQESVDHEAAQAQLAAALKQMNESGETSVSIFLNEDPDLVQEGDYVLVNYRARLKNGTFVRLFDREGSFMAPSAVDGETGALTTHLLAGDPEAEKGLGMAVMGMKIGQKTRVSLDPDKAFGSSDPRKLKTYPRSRRYPRTMEFKPGAYLKQFNEFPVKDKMLSFGPYLEAQVILVEEERVVIELLAENGKTVADALGETLITLDEDAGEVVLTITPQEGVRFGDGIVTAVREDGFEVDTNHPLANETVDIELEVAEIVKPSTFGNNRIEWIEDYEQGVELAASEGKAVLLFLYADWCEWCQKMMGGTFKDPWIKFFKDDYVFIKVNSDQEKAFQLSFEQKSFPMTVLMNSRGEILKKLNGYKQPVAMRKDLLEIINRENETV